MQARKWSVFNCSYRLRNRPAGGFQPRQAATAGLSRSSIKTALHSCFSWRTAPCQAKSTTLVFTKWKQQRTVLLAVHGGAGVPRPLQTHRWQRDGGMDGEGRKCGPNARVPWQRKHQWTRRWLSDDPVQASKIYCQEWNVKEMRSSENVLAFFSFCMPSSPLAGADVASCWQSRHWRNFPDTKSLSCNLLIITS